MRTSPAPQIAALAESVISGRPITGPESLWLLNLTGSARYDLFYWANRIRLSCLGEEISCCSIASVRTGSCSEDCSFCAQSSRYPSSVSSSVADHSDVFSAAVSAASHGASCFGLVSSGRSATDEQIAGLSSLIDDISGIGTLGCSVSLGCLSDSQAERLYELGVRWYHHNLETSERFFPKVVSTHSFSDRLATVKAAKRAGLRVCCGGIIGMGESRQDRLDLAMALRDLDVDSVPLNFLRPIAGTPLADSCCPAALNALEALQAVSVFRFILPAKPIRIAAGRVECLGDLQSWMFFAGASGFMLGDYLTTQGRSVDDDLRMLADLGLADKLCFGRGCG